MRVAICGGGLVGLTLGRLLALHGHDAVILERMTPGKFVPRGFMLGHHGFGAVQELGLLDDLQARGRAIGTQPDGTPAAIAVAVGWLLHQLADGAPARYGVSVNGLVHDDTGRVTGVQIDGDGGSEMVAADLVVACDGRNSRVRQMAGLTAEVVTTAEGKIEWMSDVPSPVSFAMAYMSNGGHIGLLSWPEGSFGWRSTDPVGREAALAPGRDALIASWERLLPEAADAVRGVRSMDEVFYDQPQLLRCPQWWTPGVVLIGDAAHFFGPETGASAGVGMADAHALAQAITAHRGDPDAACATYETWRAPAIRPLEAMDPSRARCDPATIAPAAAQERWPPPD